MARFLAPHTRRIRLRRPLSWMVPDRLFAAAHEFVCGVRRDKAALSNGCKSRPANAPAGSNRSAMEVTKWLKPSDSG